MLFRIFLSGVAATLGWASSLSAAVLYVDSVRGKDEGTGSEVAPYRTMAHAVGKAKAGDTIFLVSTYINSNTYQRESLRGN